MKKKMVGKSSRVRLSKLIAPSYYVQRDESYAFSQLLIVGREILLDGLVRLSSKQFFFLLQKLCDCAEEM